MNTLDASLIKIETCPKCKKEYRNNFDVFSIQARSLCVDCGKAKDKADAIEESKKDFRVSISASANFTVRAEDEVDAAELAREMFIDESDDFDISVREV